MKLLFPLSIFLLVACNSGQNTATVENSFTNKDTSKEIIKSAGKLEKNANEVNQNLLGIWTDGSSENASFDIRKDSIYYVDQFATYNYSLTGDSIKIYYPDWTFTGAISFSKDTLTIASEDETTKYWKFVK